MFCCLGMKSKSLYHYNKRAGPNPNLQVLDAEFIDHHGFEVLTLNHFQSNWTSDVRCFTHRQQVLYDESYICQHRPVATNWPIGKGIQHYSREDTVCLMCISGS